VVLKRQVGPTMTRSETSGRRRCLWRLQTITMRVRLLAPTERRARSERRPHIFGRPAKDVEPAPPTAAPAPAATPAPAAAPAQPVDEHLAERRHRDAVTPEDTALYGCSCGFQFQAPVSTSVSCPHCGTGQAW
jgi:hypothetical protein